MNLKFIINTLENIWNVWNIRGLMILSLCLQLVLALTAPCRMKISNRFFILVVWSAYLLADWAALFGFGLISNATRCKNSNNNAIGCLYLENYDEQVPPEVLAFWTAFLLVHLGGPDAITAFSLEDNALWLRHLVGLIAQLSVFLYIFMKALPHNKLLVPTTLIFVAGVIKYGERTRALYLASLENLKKSIKKTISSDDISSLHEISKGLIVDIRPDHSECMITWKAIFDEYPLLSLGRILIELSRLYEVLYTKIKAANSGWGKFARSIAYFITLAAFILFCLTDKQEFQGVDIAITYALLGGVFILHVSNLLMLSTSYFWKLTCKEIIMLVFGQGFIPFVVVFALHSVRSFLERCSVIKRFLDREWSEKMGSFNLLSHCFKQGATTQCQKPGKLKFRIPRVLAYQIDYCTIAGFIWSKLAEMRHTSREEFVPELFDFVVEDLKRKTAGTFDKERKRKVYEARGEWALEERGCRELKPYINVFEYDNTLLIWHVATEICYNIEEEVGDADKMKRLSKVLSDYIMYLLVRQPKLMSPVAGITHIRYEETCTELKLLRRKFSVPNVQSFCAKILKAHPGITEPTDEGHRRAHSVLKYSCGLVQLIKDKNNRWEIIFNVWMELLSYAASHCRADSHARLLSEGGEFITLVWILMALLGVGA